MWSLGGYLLETKQAQIHAYNSFFYKLQKIIALLKESNCLGDFNQIIPSDWDKANKLQ